MKGPNIVRAYQLVGFTPDRDYGYIEINRELRALHPEVMAGTISGIEEAGGQVEQNSLTQVLTINGEFTASIVIVRCRETDAGSLRWHVGLDTGLAPDISIVVRMDPDNKAPQDYYLLPRIDMTLPRIRLAEHNGVSLDSYRFEGLETLFRMAARVRLEEVA